jgi:hypothetical protein
MKWRPMATVPRRKRILLLLEACHGRDAKVRKFVVLAQYKPSPEGFVWNICGTSGGEGRYHHKCARGWAPVKLPT